MNMELIYPETLDISVIMPCLNEENTIGMCIDNALSYIAEHHLKGEVLIVDNGSTDASSSVAKEHGAEVISKSRKGYGIALRTGISHARGRVIVYGDSDTTYDFLHMDGLVRPLMDGSCDMACGNRFAGGIEKGAMPFLHRIGVPFLSVCANLRYGTKIHDYHCGLRGLTRETAEKLTLVTEGMEFATEIIAQAAMLGLNILEVPVPLYCPDIPRKTHLRTFYDGLRHLALILKKTPSKPQKKT